MVSEDSDQLVPGLFCDSSFARSRRCPQDPRGSGGHRSRPSQTQRANFSKSRCFDECNGCVMKNGMIVLIRSLFRRRTHIDSGARCGCRTACSAITLPTPKKLVELLQTRDALCALRDRKFVSHLIAGPVALATRPRWLPNESDGEASLSVYKTNNPAELNQPFLLIVCTRHIVTVPPAWDGTRSAGYSGFQHMARCSPHGYPCGGQRSTLGPFLTVTTRVSYARAARTFLADSHGRP